MIITNLSSGKNTLNHKLIWQQLDCIYCCHFFINYSVAFRSVCEKYHLPDDLKTHQGVFSSLKAKFPGMIPTLKVSMGFACGEKR